MNAPARTRIKFCGMTSAEDVRLAVDAGADALGFIFAVSPRRLTLELHLESNLHLALPETPAFLAADLSHDPGAALAKAESKHS